MWKLTIKPDTWEEPFELYAEDVDFSWGYLISISGVSLPVKSSIITIQNQAYEEFKDAEQLIIPHSNLCFAKKIKSSINPPEKLKPVRELHPS